MLLDLTNVCPLLTKQYMQVRLQIQIQFIEGLSPHTWYSYEFWSFSLWAPALMDNGRKSIDHWCSSVLQSMRLQNNNKTNKCLHQDLNRVLHDWNRATYQLCYQPLTITNVCLYSYYYICTNTYFIKLISLAM
jgi:hypothetical protein